MSKKIIHPINVDHIARIEGKAGIEVIIDKKEIQELKVNIFEGPRFFESIAVGKHFEDAVAVFPRVCSFCAAAHKITPVIAAENAIGLEVTEQTHKIREMLYIGDYIQSHALHLFFLALPDFLGYPDVFSMNKDHKDVVDAAIALKDIGADMQAEIGSRSIHQENAIIGGFGKVPTKSQWARMRGRLRSLRNTAEEALEQLVSFPPWAELDSSRVHLALRPQHEIFMMFGDTIHSTDGSSFKAKAYQMRITEEVVPHSFAKHSSYNDAPFMTGAISRVTLFRDKLSDRARNLADIYTEFLNPDNPLSNNFAQAIELVHYIHHAENLADDLATDLKDERRIKPEITKAGTGVCVTEAPRGLLAYTLKILKSGKVKSANIITPTAMFLPQVEIDLRQKVNAMLEEGITRPNVMAHKLETVVRAYDPCVSCSVHVADVSE
jgi:sulfhydrogenase subunit alpha